MFFSIFPHCLSLIRVGLLIGHASLFVSGAAYSFDIGNRSQISTRSTKSTRDLSKLSWQASPANRIKSHQSGPYTPIMGPSGRKLLFFLIAGE